MNPISNDAGMQVPDRVRVEGPPDNFKFIFDPAGFVYIYIMRQTSGLIVVEHYLNVSRGTAREVDTGKLNMIFTGTDARALGLRLLEEKLVTRRDHALYLGRELQKAQNALELGIDYQQDTPLKIEGKDGFTNGRSPQRDRKVSPKGKDNKEKRNSAGACTPGRKDGQA